MVASACETESCWKPATAPMARIFFFLGWAERVSANAAPRIREIASRYMTLGYRIQDRSLTVTAQNPECALRNPYALASNTMLKGVSAARRKWRKPPEVTTSRSLASPACAPSASPTSCAIEAGVQTRVEAE